MNAMPRPLVGPRKRGLALVVFLTLVQGAGAGAAALATRALFDAMHAGTMLTTWPLAVLVGAGGMIAAARVLARRQGEALGQDYARALRRALFEHAARMPVSAVAERRAGYMALRFVGDMTAFRDWLALGLPRLIAAAVLVPAALTVLAVLSPAMALALLPLLAIGLGAGLLGGRRLVPLHRALRARRARIAAEMAERMPLAPRLDGLGRRALEMKRLDTQLDAMIAVALRRTTFAEALKALPDILAGLAAVTVFVAGVRAGATPGTVAGGLAALGLIVQPLRDLGSVWNLHAAHLAARDKAAAALARRERTRPVARKALGRGPLSLVLESVSLPSGAVASLSLKPGAEESITLDDRDVSALFDAIQRMETPVGGRIAIGGMDLLEISAGSLRRRVLCLGGPAVLLQGSVRRALTLGLDDRPDDARLTRWAEEADLGPMLHRLGGLDGRVAEGGRGLSERERCLIGLVRARARKPGLILLDTMAGRLNDADRQRVEGFISGSGASVLRAMAPGIEAHQGRPIRYA